MREQEKIRKKLHEAGLRATPQRLQILSVLEGERHARTTEEIYRLCPPGGMNLATVYRTLSTLSGRGTLHRVMGADGMYRYYLLQGSHHHQVVCTRCGDAADLSDCPVEQLKQHLKADTGYVITTHCLELGGLCPRCQQEEKKTN